MPTFTLDIHHLIVTYYPTKMASVQDHYTSKHVFEEVGPQFPHTN